VKALKGERWIGFPPTNDVRDSSGHGLVPRLIRAGLDDADVTLIDSLTAQKRLARRASASPWCRRAACATSCVRACSLPSTCQRCGWKIPFTAIHRRNGYLSPAARTLLALLTGKPLKPRRQRRST